MELNFIEQTTTNEPLSGIGAHQSKVVVTCRCSCSLEGVFDAVGDESKRRCSLCDRGLLANVSTKRGI